MINDITEQEIRKDVVKLLEQGKTVMIKPEGGSMSPLFASGRDIAIIKPIEGVVLKRGDIILYRRNIDNILVLHRIYKLKDGMVYTLGDNQTKVEGPFEMGQVYGIMSGMIRKGRPLEMNGLWYRVISGTWLFVRPIRPVIMIFVNKYISHKKAKH